MIFLFGVAFVLLSQVAALLGAQTLESANGSAFVCFIHQTCSNTHTHTCFQISAPLLGNHLAVFKPPTLLDLEEHFVDWAVTRNVHV